MIKYISNSAHYQEVIAQIKTVKHTLWIGTADIKDLYVELGKDKKPFLALIAQLIRKGVEVRLIHAKEPGQAFREDFDNFCRRTKRNTHVRKNQNKFGFPLA